MPPDCVTEYFATETAWQRTLLPYQRQMQADVAALIPHDVQTVLDAGCGDGVITNVLPESLDVTGLDMSRTALSRVARKTVEGSVLELPFADGQFDLVMCNDVLEHLEAGQRRRAVAELTRVAKRYVLVSVPHREDLLQSATQCASCTGWYHINHHVDSFDAADVTALFAGQPLACLSQTLSGDTWWRDPPNVVALRRLSGLQHAPTDAPVCPYCGANETVAVRPARRRSRAADWLAAAQCLAQPEWVDYGLQRTEVITLFRRGEHAPQAANDGSWQTLDADGSPVGAAGFPVRNDRIDFRHAEVFRRPFAPRYGWLPYFVSPVENETPQVLRSGERLLCGFFLDARHAEFRVRGRAGGRCRLTVSRYLDPWRSPFPGRRRVQGEFDAAFRCRPVPSRHGCLFILQARGGDVELGSVSLETGTGTERTMIDNRDGRARFLAKGGSPLLQVSLPLYGDAVDVEQIVRSVEAPFRATSLPVDPESARERLTAALEELRPLTKRPGVPRRYRNAIR